MAGWRLLKRTFQEWWEDNTFRLAASLAFYTMFSLAPVLLIAVGVASIFLSREQATERILAQVREMIGPQGAQGVGEVLKASSGFGKGIWAIAVGGVTFILGASMVFTELQAALNKIWDVQAEPRHGVILAYLLDRVRSFGIALGVGFLLLVSLGFSAAISGLQEYLTRWMPQVPWLWQAMNVITSFFVVLLLFAMIYKFLPDVCIQWKDVWIGAAVTAALFTGGKYLIGVYLGQTAMASAFGAAGSFAVLLIWVYYSALVSFFGAEFTQVYARRNGVGIRPQAHARKLGTKPDAS